MAKKCMKCGGAMKMAKGGAVAKPFAAGIPYATGAGATDGKNGMMRKGGAVKKMADGGPTKKSSNKTTVSNSPGIKKVTVDNNKMKASSTYGRYGNTREVYSKNKGSRTFVSEDNKGNKDVIHINKDGKPYSKSTSTDRFGGKHMENDKVKVTSFSGANGKSTSVTNKKTGTSTLVTSDKKGGKDVLVVKADGKSYKKSTKMQTGGTVKNAKLAALAAPKNKITRADVIVGAKRNAKKK
jgi:hypothetical protein